jgi:hypothetical protein
MLASVTLDNPPLASEVQRKHGRCPREPSPAAQDHIRQAAALTVTAITAMTAAAILVLGAVLALIVTVLQGGRVWGPAQLLRAPAAPRAAAARGPAGGTGQR